MYRCEATSVEGFVQQLAVGYVARGYLFYVASSIPAACDAKQVDHKIVSKYGIDISKFTRCRQNKLGTAPIQYLRCGRFFVILAKLGFHQFFVEEGFLRNLRIHPIHFAGYSIASGKGRDGKWHASVRIEKREFKILKRELLDMALVADEEELARKFSRLGFAPYAPIRDQYRILLRAVNRARKTAGLSTIPLTVLPAGRRVVKPFEPFTEFSRGA